MEKNKPVRTCVCCRREFFKSELLRIVRTPSGEFIVDKSGKADGRGAYICGDKNCLKKLKKSKMLNRAFRAEVSESVYGLAEEFFANEKQS